MAAPSKIPFRLILLLAVVPCIWWGLDHFGVLGVPNNIAENSLFQFRGEIPAYDGTKPDHPPLKIVYVDVDAATVSFYGERPWPRERYASMINALFKLGHAKAVGLDFILSPAGMKSKLIDQKEVIKNDTLMALAMEENKTAIIGTLYSGSRIDFSLPESPESSTPATADKTAPAPSPAPTTVPATKREMRFSIFPYIYENETAKNPVNNVYPEGPTYPIIKPGPIQTGMLDVATEYNADSTPDSIPRWVPLFAETKGPDHTDNIAYGFVTFTKDVTPDFVVDQGDKIMLLDPEGGQPLILPEIQDITFFHMSVKLALAYLGLDDHNVKFIPDEQNPDALDIVDNSGKTLIHIPLTEHQLAGLTAAARRAGRFF